MAKKAARHRQEIPVDESKADRFTRVVIPRVDKAIKSIKIIGYCASSTYKYTPQQIAKIVSTLQDAINAIDDKFAKRTDKAGEFSFKD